MVENISHALNQRYHREYKRLTKSERKKMTASHKPYRSDDFRDIYFDRYEEHCLLVSNDGALAIYKRKDVLYWKFIGQYEKETPIFSKLSLNGLDVFGRGVRKNYF